MNRAAFFEEVRATFGPLKQAQVDGFEVVLSACSALSIRHQAYLLATAWHETAFTMQPIHERGGRSYFNKYEPATRIGKRLGNTAPGDGYRFRGRGYVQLTGRDNYVRAGKATATDLAGNPDAALNPTLAARILVKGCMEGWFTGKGLPDYSDYLNMRRVVNGTDKAGDIARYAHQFERALDAADIRTNTPASPTPPPAGKKPGVSGRSLGIGALVIAIGGALVAFKDWITGLF